MDKPLSEPNLVPTERVSQLQSLADVLAEVSQKKALVNEIAAALPDELFFVDIPCDEFYQQVLAGMHSSFVQSVEVSSGANQLQLNRPVLSVASYLNQEDFPEKRVAAFSSTTLSRRSHYLVVPSNGEFHYYRCPGVDSGGPFIDLAGDILPFEEALYILDKSIYYVPQRDLVRRRVRKTNVLHVRTSTITISDVHSGSLTSAPPRARPQSNAESATDVGIPGAAVTGDVVTDIESEELQAASLAFQDQIGALLGVSSQEEIVWENPDNPQS
jgi:signal peptidase I